MSTVVPDGAAARAGIQEGDVVIEINGQPTNTFEQLATAIDRANVGDDIEIVLIRNGEQMTVTATLQPWDLS